METEQNIKNIQSQTAEASFNYRKKTSLMKAISEMNINGLQHLLDNNTIYQHVTKDVFLNKINDLFENLKKKDSTLLLAEGKCNSKECQNYKNCGTLFYGDNTGDNFNLIFEEDDYDNIIDIRYCHEFKSHKTLRKTKNGRELKIDFYDDEVADFIPNSEYNYINTTSIEGLTEFKNFVEDSTSEKDILDWLQKYSELNNSISFFNLIYLNEHSFYNLYKYLNSHTDFFNTKEGRTKVIHMCNSLLEEKKTYKIWHTTNYLRDELRKLRK